VEHHAGCDAVDLRRPGWLPLEQPPPAGARAGGGAPVEGSGTPSVADEIIADWAAELAPRFELSQLSRAALLPARVLEGALDDLERHGRVRRVGRETYEVLG
jgi:hypothetical protein